ncbi:MAG: hypothetical protein AAGI91_03075 [Bacteroidota bacterium]
MDGSRTRAGIELLGRVMRYAEVDLGGASGEGRRLRRLGACDFDFGVAETLLALTGPSHLDTVTTAVREIFDGSEAETLQVVVHPWNSTSFFSPLPEGMPPAERFEQLRQEAAMLSDASIARPVRVKTTPVRIETQAEGRRVHWHHVLRFSESIHARLAHIAASVSDAEPAVKHEVADTTGAAAAVLAQIHREEDESFVLAVGVYGSRTEFALCRGATWHFGHYAEADLQTDGTYFAAAMLDRLDVRPADVGHLYLYGEPGATSAAASLEALLGLEAAPLNPLLALGQAPGGADPLALAAFVPVLGALLR